MDRDLAQMFTLRVIADPSDPNDFASRDYRNYLFITATSIFHEIDDRPYVVGHEKRPKASLAANLEQMVFGGVVYLYRDRDPATETAVDACGTPYLADADGVYRILPETISKTVKGDFEFPYRHEGIAEEPTLLMAMDNLPDDVITDPIDHPMWGQPLGPPPARP
ncbi:hypothetical protein HO173_001492 [Letharia columbiana]|uniref:Uncharacterized protein n=1 Tax=Letharia columbiana TaxID=112416 RepID=A0A8H6L9K4_9LECA|nr:uncharacterized protein HO173_001492 [Letharia columbiana]KAF6240819.1 hypothetical protein HO173_001492 [Letharia columbiana]